MNEKLIMKTTPYRPHNPGHDYYAAHPEMQLSPLGEAVQQVWKQIPERQAEHGNRVEVHACVCMPDHFHGVIEVKEPMEWSLGDIMQGMKTACTQRWWQMNGVPASINRPNSVDCNNANLPKWLREKAAIYRSDGELIRHLSKKQRQEYYALVGRSNARFSTTTTMTPCASIAAIAKR